MHSSYSLLLLLASAFNIHLSNGLDFKHHNNTELAAVLQQVPLSWQLVFKKSWNMFDLRNIGANSWRSSLCVSVNRSTNKAIITITTTTMSSILENYLAFTLFLLEIHKATHIFLSKQLHQGKSIITYICRKKARPFHYSGIFS